MELSPTKNIVNTLEKRGKLALGDEAEGWKALRLTAVTVNMPSAADGVTVGADATVTGIALTDLVLAVSSTTDMGDDYTLTGMVTAANTVRVTGTNNSGGTLDHTSETFYILWLDRT